MTRKELLLPCIAGFLALIFLAGLWRTHAVGAISFRSDAAYMDLAIARTLGGHGILGTGPELPVPATRDTLWRAVLAVAGWFFSDFTYAALGLGALFGVWSLVLVFRLGRYLIDSELFSGFVGIVLILSPALFLGAISGSSLTLSMTLLLGATMLHLRSLGSRDTLLSMCSAMLVGLACWLRLEFGLLWIIFWFHALICALVEHNRGRNVGFVMVRGVSGLLIVALCLSPLVGWNLRVLGVPWPRVMEAPLSLDLTTTSGSGMVTLYFRTVLDAISGSYAMLQDIPFLKGMIQKCSLLAGVIFVMAAHVRLAAVRSHGFFIVLLLAPIFYALFYPFTGWSGAEFVFRSFTPLWIVLAAYGAWRCADEVVKLLRKFNVAPPGLMPQLGVYLAFCFPLAASGFVRTVQATRENVNLQMEAAAARAHTLRVLDGDAAPDQPRLVATDLPGWLLYRGIAAVEITGETNPDILARLNAEGRPDAQAVSGLLRKWQATHLILWDPKYVYIRDELPCTPVHAEADAGQPARPEICRLNWSAAP